jgi:osmotically-inducible protein OsmY
MGILTLAQTALAETGPHADRGVVSSLDPKTPAAPAATDAWITTAPRVRSMANSLTPAFDLTVASKQGVFTLFGTVPRGAVRSDAEVEVRKIDRMKGV